MYTFTDKFKCTTNIEEQMHQFEIEWKIQREVFQQLVREEDSKRTSAVYKSNFHGFSWQLKLSHNRNHPDNLGLHLMLIKSNEITVNFLVKWNYLIKHQTKDVNDRNDQKWYELKPPSYSNGYTKWKLIKNLENEGFWINNYLTIICKVEVKVLGEERTEVQLDLSPPIIEEQLSLKLLSLLNSGDHSDVTIIVGFEKFQVHKSILTMNSEYFSTMFKSGFKEANVEELEIREVSSDIFKIILEFIYVQKIPENLEDRAKDILVAAHLFRLQSLVEVCGRALSKNVNTENCVELMNLAELFGLQDLKQNVFVVIKSNLKCFLNTEEWKQLKTTNSQLAVEIIENVV